jgi:Flp pilus assembly protein CpaB
MSMAHRGAWAACLFLLAAGCASERRATEAARTTILVAKKRIPTMTYIKKAEDFFEIEKKRVTAVPKDAVTDLNDKDIRDGFRVTRNFVKGTILTRDDLFTKEMEGGSRWPVGIRGFRIKVSADSLAGGFVLPGSRVDVLWTYLRKTGKSESSLILENRLVLAVDSDTNAYTVTLAVRTEDAEWLSLAAEAGELRLILRSSDTPLPIGPGNVEDGSAPPVVPPLPPLPDETNPVVIPPLPPLPKD